MARLRASERRREKAEQRVRDLEKQMKSTASVVISKDTLVSFRFYRKNTDTEDLLDRAQWLQNAMEGDWSALTKDAQAWRQALVEHLIDQTENCIIFSHFVAINAAVGAATNDDRMRIFAPDNCSVTTLENTGGRLAVIALGVTAETHIN
mgnify:CR=1 FL=1